MADDALALALTAVDVGQSQPGRVRQLTDAARAVAPDDAEVHAVCERALALACAVRGELAESIEHLRSAIRIGEAAGLPARAAEARGTLGYLLMLTGDTDDALREINRAIPVLRGVPGARLRMNKALVLTEIGRLTDATRAYARAAESLRRAGGSPLIEADLRNNRAILNTRRRDWRAVEEDLQRAEELYTASGHPDRIALVSGNRAIAATIRGDIPAALAFFDDAARRYRAAGRTLGLGPVEKAEALLSVRLTAEARAEASAAAADFARTGNATDLAQARLVLARAALLDGNHQEAFAEADAARRSYQRLKRPGWAALAGYLALRASEQDAPSIAVLRAGRRAVGALTAAGWVVQALDARLIVARTALALGKVGIARRELADASAARHNGPADLRASAWHAEALTRLADGDRRGADRALRAGVGVLDRFRDSLGATELRAHAAGQAGELATLGVRLALQDGDANRVLAWAERWRAGALRLPPVRPPQDAALADDLAELRQVAAEIAAQGGTTGTLLRRQTRLERSIRARARHAPGAGADAPPAPPLRDALGDRVLIEYLAVDGELAAVVVGAGPPRLCRLGPVGPVAAALDSLRFGLRRLAYDTGPERGRALAAASVERAATRLDALLWPDIGDGHEVVVVPTGALHGVPWAALPSCVGRPVSVAPSAALWLRAEAAPLRDGRQVFVAGPGLAHAPREVAALAARHPGSVRFTGGRATVAAVAEALDGAAVAHIAAHAHLRADNPLFSSLQLADGPLTVYDLERLKQAPQHVVLSACESGLPEVRPGDEQLGLAAALLAMGTTSLVATVLPVPDELSRTAMLRFDGFRRRGLRPAESLARTQQELPAAAAFLCFGAG